MTGDLYGVEAQGPDHQRLRHDPGRLQNDPKKVLPPSPREHRKDGPQAYRRTISMGRHAPGSARRLVHLHRDMPYVDATPKDPGSPPSAAWSTVWTRPRRSSPAGGSQAGVGAMKGEMLVKPLRVTSIRRAPACGAAHRAAPPSAPTRVPPPPRRARNRRRRPMGDQLAAEQVTGVEPCPLNRRGLAVAGGAPRPGEPLYPRNHLFRPAQVVREMLCPMCGEPTAEGVPLDPDRPLDHGQGHPRQGPRRLAAASSPTTGACWTPAPSRPCTAPAPSARSFHCRPEGHGRHSVEGLPRRLIVAALSVEARPSHALSNVPQRAVAAVTFLQLIGCRNNTG